MKPHSLSAVSFRDPAGFVYCRQDDLRRQVNLVYREHFDRLLATGLYDELVDAGLLVKHEEVQEEAFEPELAYKVIRPERIPFVSYAFEWGFSQFQDAALTVLEVQRRALLRGMTLKDCSAYNVQFHAGRPILIDTLSFEVHREGQAWTGYRQFCEHFLAPLALMSLRDQRLGQLLRANIDGVPLDLAARILPWRSRLRWGLAIHLFLHAALQHKHADRIGPSSSGRLSTHSQLGLVDSLSETIRGLRWKPPKRGWASYYDEQSYTPVEFQTKARLVAEFLNRTGAQRVWDLGANTGYFSRLACEQGLATIAFDSDPACVDTNYREAKRRNETRLLPLVLDLFNPTPPAGWLNRERLSIFERGKPDLVLALALIHHLALSGSQPLENLAEFFEGLAPWLVIEFVPETDPQARLLRNRRAGIHHLYDREHFQNSFNEFFTIVATEPVSASGRTLYLMRRRNPAR
jgi:ribosomal protein L11 methylase PrmA